MTRATFGLIAQSPEIDQNPVGTGPFISTEQSQWSLFRNMAGLAESDKWNVVLAYHYPYTIKQLQSLTLGISVPSDPTLGISIFQKGDNYFLNQQIALSTAKKIGELNLGLRVKYWRLTFAGHSQISHWSAAIGMQVRLSENLVAGAFISNITQNKVGKDELLPFAWYTGISYYPSSKLQLVLEIGHYLEYTWEYKLGFDYRLKDRISIRSGFNSSGRQGHFGAGFQMNNIELDYAVGVHLSLGISHQAGLCYSWE